MVLELVCIRALHNYAVGDVIKPEDVERYQKLYWHSVVERTLPGDEEASETTDADVEAATVEVAGPECDENASDTMDEECEEPCQSD